MKNIKVNYKNASGKPTSTTINGQICWCFFKTTDIFKSNEGDHSSFAKSIQDFVNSISLSWGDINKSLIEDLMLSHIMQHEFERGMEIMQKPLKPLS